MSKSALGQMTRALALEWGRYGVRVNALAPGFILTDLTQKLWTDPGMGTAKHAFGTAWGASRFGWRVAIFGQSSLFVRDGANLLCGRRLQAG